MRRWAPLTILLLFTACVLPWAARVQMSAGAGGWIDSHGPAATALGELESRFGRQDGFVIGLFAPDVLDPACLAWQRQLAAELLALPGIAGVDGMMSAQDVVVDETGPEPLPLLEADRADILNHPLYAGLLVSHDGTAAALLAAMRMDVDEPAAASLALRIQDLLATSPPPSGAQAVLGGLPMQQSAINHAVIADQALTIPLTFILLGVVLIVVLRDTRLVILCLTTIGCSLVWTMAALGMAGRSIDALIGLLPALVLGIGVATSLHLIHAVAMAMRDSASHPLRQALRTASLPLLLATLTAIAGVAGLWWGAVPAVRAFAPWASLGVLIAGIAPFLFIPAAMPLLPAASWSASAAGWAGDRLGSALGRLAAACQRRRIIVLAAALAAAAAGTLLCLHLRVDADFVHALPPADPVRIAHERIDAGLTGAVGLDILIDVGHVPTADDLHAIEPVVLGLRSDPSVAHVLSLADVVHLVVLRGDHRPPDEILADLKIGAKPVYQRFVGSSLGSGGPAHVLRIMARQHDGSIAEAAKAARRAETAAHKAFPQATVRMASGALLLDETTSRLLPATVNSLAASKIAVVLLLLLFLRSVRLALVAMAITLLPLLLTYAAIPALGWPLDVAVSMIACIALGMIMNDAVHLTYALDRHPDPADALRSSGPALAASAAALGVAFAACAMGGFAYTRRFGILLALAFAIGLVVNLLVAPALARKRT
jgi:uncharacterized protein